MADVERSESSDTSTEGSGKANFMGRLLDGWTAEYCTKEVLLGVTIGFAQIPESVAFAFLAHVRPPVALHAAWMVGLFCSLFGGRPGMVNGATGAFAAIIATFLPAPTTPGGNGDGVELLFPSVMLGGVLMLLASTLRLSRFILLLPSPVMIGFCNGLAVVIGLAQLHPFRGGGADGHGWKQGGELLWMLAITGVSMLTMEFLPKVPLRVFKVIPSSLMAVLIAVIMELAIVRPLGARTDTIGDISEFTAESALPRPFFVPGGPNQGYDLHRIVQSSQFLSSIAVQGLLLCVVGTIESLMTSEVVESFVRTPSDGDRTVLAMGLGNIISGFFGGMGGNAMIGLSTINVLNGGRGRLAPCCTALVVMAAVMGAYPLLNYIPVAALAGIMLVVVLHTFKWFSLPMLAAALLPARARRSLGLHRKVPRVEAFVVVLVTLMAIFLNIAYAVGSGVAVCALAFAWDAGKTLEVESAFEGGKKVYRINGPLFFATANRLGKVLDAESDPAAVEVHFGYATLMDYTSIETLHRVAVAYKNLGKAITFHTLNQSSLRIIEKANQLVEAIEYIPGEPISTHTLPGLVDGFRNDPMARSWSVGQEQSSSQGQAQAEEDIEKAIQGGGAAV